MNNDKPLAYFQTKHYHIKTQSSSWMWKKIYFCLKKKKQSQVDSPSAALRQGLGDPQQEVSVWSPPAPPFLSSGLAHPTLSPFLGHGVAFARRFPWITKHVTSKAKECGPSSWTCRNRVTCSIWGHLCHHHNPQGILLASWLPSSNVRRKKS